MELWLVRHGRTPANEENRFQGRLDVPLNDRGKEEAMRLSHRLTGAGEFDLLLSSDLQRAWETAAIISRGIKLAPCREPLLRECSWGWLEGLRRDEAETAFPFLFRPPGGAPRALRCGGEGKRRLLARTKALRQKIGRKYGTFRRIILVSHARLINAFIAGCMELSSRQRWPYAPAPASLTIARYDPVFRHFDLLLFNDTAHLEP